MKKCDVCHGSGRTDNHVEFASPILTEMFCLNLAVCVEGIVDVPQDARNALLRKLNYLRESLKVARSATSLPEEKK